MGILWGHTGAIGCVELTACIARHLGWSVGMPLPIYLMRWDLIWCNLGTKWSVLEVAVCSLTLPGFTFAAVQTRLHATVYEPVSHCRYLHLSIGSTQTARHHGLSQLFSIGDDSTTIFSREGCTPKPVSGHSCMRPYQLTVYLIVPAWAQRVPINLWVI